jgi:hypothetical protein
MTAEISARAFFGDRDQTFTLTDPLLSELERITGLGVGAIYYQFTSFAVPTETLREIIRLGLIGGGTAPHDAKRLVETYASNRPITELFPLAFAVLDARWTGTADKTEVTQ